MQQVHDRLYVGGDEDCRTGGGDWSIVHAYKHPCHRDAVGYTDAPPHSHRHYLSKREDGDLYLNMIDPEKPLFKKEMFEDFFSFTVPRWKNGESQLLIHCNQGRSRSPSLALLLLASHSAAIPDDSFTSARGQFEELYPAYRPSRGIRVFLQNNWDELLHAGLSE